MYLRQAQAPNIKLVVEQPVLSSCESKPQKQKPPHPEFTVGSKGFLFRQLYICLLVANADLLF